MSWKIVSDSSCDLNTSFVSKHGVEFAIASLIIRVGECDFVDNAALDVGEMIKALKQESAPSSSACPSIDDWASEFETADNVFAITISSCLSGSYQSACAARDIVLAKYPEKKVYVLDSLSTGGQMALVIKKVDELIGRGLSFEEVTAQAEKYNSERALLFVLSSYDRLVKNGRMSKLVGAIATTLKVVAIGIASPKGTINIIDKAKGQTQAINKVLNHIKGLNDVSGKEVIISHCENFEAANHLKNLLEGAFRDVMVTIMPMRGLTSYYAELKGLIIGF